MLAQGDASIFEPPSLGALAGLALGYIANRAFADLIAQRTGLIAATGIEVADLLWAGTRLRSGAAVRPDSGMARRR